MYLAEFVAPGPLTDDIADELSWKTAEFTSRIVLIVHGRRVGAQCLSLCWKELKIRRGTAVAVTTDRGFHPPDLEDRRALKEFTELFQTLTARR
ncbi:hypothetical protein FOS14_10780 [Skermania sp. ID1734]|uniref:hypothetical protein n=1 Tax=Skermania sp. ID1734 TaxID=2597516 RepID=UPI00117DB367|nr:hypothetical protein [Skermania sp. ID1734]TSD99739.1 hypothetical protein FOS14_10780 [Skermania sp. ID1734]